MAAVTIALAVLVVIGAGASVLIPGLRRAGQALALTTVLAGALALTLGSVAVALALVLAAVILVGLLQVSLPADGRAHPAPARALIAPAVLAAAILVALAWAALQPGWPAGTSPAALTSRPPSGQLVPLAACLVLLVTAALATLTLREPRAAHREDAPPPRRGASSARRTPRGRSRG